MAKRKTKKNKKSGFSKAQVEDDRIRAENHKLIKVRKDGVKICPPRHCEGFGYNSNFFVADDEKTGQF